MNNELFQPLADRLRPDSLDEYFGQKHLIAPGKTLYQAVTAGRLHSMILWGPPGTGKTTLARLIARHSDAAFLPVSAVLGGVKEIRAAVAEAQQYKQQGQRRSILFVDEVHRFNKAQQDAFLPHVEDGTVFFIGATTENPSFELNNALLSRARVYVLKSLTQDDLIEVIDRALTDTRLGYGQLKVEFSPELKKRFALAADGDARRLLNFIELAVQMAESVQEEPLVISEELADEVLAGRVRRFDKQGDVFYEQISALHKSVRGSNPDAALYWFCRMLDGGCDPLYLARRIVRIASEDVGNADPRALQLALNAWDTQQRLGSPEGELALAQAVVYLSCAAKSNAVYTAYNQARADAAASQSFDVPEHLRNAPTQLMKNMGFGKEYRYAHDEPDAYAAGVNYFPDEMQPRQYYQPVRRGLETRIAEKLDYLKQLDQAKRS